MSTIKKHFLYSIIQQFLLSILPIIVTPYISRVLLVDNIGIFSYTHTIVNCFVLFTMLGIDNYGNRTIAKVRDNKDELSKNFFGIYSVQFISSLLIILLYILYLIFFVKEYHIIAFAQMFYLMSCLFNIEWFFLGLEKFNLTVPISICIKILSIISIFLFVKSSNDMLIYTLINAGGFLLEKIILFLFLKKEINFVKITFLDIKKHIKPCLLLFIPVISVSIYKQIDKLMIGILSNVTELGYYEQAEKIISIPMAIVTTLGLVMMPQISYLVKKQNHQLILKYMQKIIQFTMFLIFPICFGLIAISSDLVSVLLGNSFAQSACLVNLLSITTVFISFANVIRRQYLLPFEKDNIYIKSVILGAISNFIINAALISKYGSFGASIGTIVAEFLVMFVQFQAANKDFPIKTYLISTFPFFYKTIIMFVLVMLVKRMGFSPIITVSFQILLGIIIYFGLNISYIRTLVSNKLC